MLYCLPTFAAGRRIIFDAIASDGTRFLDYIPKHEIAAINTQQMKITFRNQAVLSIVGADDVDRSIIGTNPYMMIFSEFALMKNGEHVYSMVRPIIANNGGKIIVLSTPRGKNSLFHLYNAALKLPEWWVIRRGTTGPDGTNHIDEDALAREKAEMDPALYAQEYETSFDKGVSGQIYGTMLEQMKLDNRITYVPWLPDTLVNVVFDIGVNDSTAMLWYQVTDNGNSVRIIDAYSNHGLGMDHYISMIQSKPYRYGSYFAPHDLKVREWAGGAIPRFEVASQLGIDFTVLPQFPLQDGINTVWMNANRLWIDQSKCKGLVSALENYYREWNEEHQVYGDKPVKNWSSHYADALRYLCQSLESVKQGMSAQEFNALKAKAMYGNQAPDLFRGIGQYRP